MKKTQSVKTQIIYLLKVFDNDQEKLGKVLGCSTSWIRYMKLGKKPGWHLYQHILTVYKHTKTAQKRKEDGSGNSNGNSHRSEVNQISKT